MASTFRAASAARLMETESGALLLDLQTNTYFSLSETGLVVWNAITDGGSVADAVTTLCEQFEVTPDDARRDVETLLDELQQRRLLESSADAGA